MLRLCALIMFVLAVISLALGDGDNFWDFIIVANLFNITQILWDMTED